MERWCGGLRPAGVRRFFGPSETQEVVRFCEELLAAVTARRGVEGGPIPVDSPRDVVFVSGDL